MDNNYNNMIRNDARVWQIIMDNISFIIKIKPSPITYITIYYIGWNLYKINSIDKNLIGFVILFDFFSK